MCTNSQEKMQLFTQDKFWRSSIFEIMLNHKTHKKND